MIIYFCNTCQKMFEQLVTVLNEAEYCLTQHMLNIKYYQVFLFMISDFDLKFTVFRYF